MAPDVAQRRRQLRLAAVQPRGHVVGGYHGDVVARRRSDKPQAEALEEACPLGQIVMETQERERHAVDDEEAEPRPVRQEVGQQVQLGQKLHVVTATHLRTHTHGQSEPCCLRVTMATAVSKTFCHRLIKGTGPNRTSRTRNPTYQEDV